MRELADAGLNLIGVLSRADFDAQVPSPWRAAALLPSARSAVVLGSGGRALGAAFLASREATDGRPDPLDRFVARAVDGFAGSLRARGHDARALSYRDRCGGRFADFVALGRACGLGVPSRLGLLLHPVFGPWLGIRAVVLTSEPRTPTPPLRDFGPCRDCPAPCAAACPAGAPRADGFDVAACLATSRERPACRVGCDARRACPVGSAHAYHPALESLHRRAALAAAEGVAPAGSFR